jgi:hypothetical protein
MQRPLPGRRTYPLAIANLSHVGVGFTKCYRLETMLSSLGFDIIPLTLSMGLLFSLTMLVGSSRTYGAQAHPGPGQIPEI